MAEYHGSQIVTPAPKSLKKPHKAALLAELRAAFGTRAEIDRIAKCAYVEALPGVSARLTLVVKCQ